MPGLKRLIPIFLVLQASLAMAQEPACRTPLKPMLRVELFFGRESGGRLSVSETKWARFVRRELAPRFPGMTVLDGRGWWRDPNGRAVDNEPSKVVVIVTPDSEGLHERIEAVAAAYKARFRQQSVGIATQPVCAAF
ncbi:MAG TPA: DUF3574 domain-containing protein [Pseudolabrys sp.]|nr:DUF3574 domain-containing protein [Pseudolabrys sp.]